MLLRLEEFMVKKEYLNQPKINKTAVQEREKMNKDKLLKEEIESNRRVIKSYYGGTNPND